MIVVGQHEEEDRKLLISLLNEYSEKLSLVCHKIEDSRSGEYPAIFNFLVSITLGSLGTSILWVLVINYSGGIIFNPMINLVNLIIGGGGLILFILWLASSFARLRRHQNQQKSLMWEATVFSKRLEKVVQIVSQMQEHSTARLPDRIEMDLRLADTELVLLRYENLSKKKDALTEFNELSKSSVISISRSFFRF
jgi:hypothetical protein